MERIWSRPIGMDAIDGSDYWEYFAEKLFGYVNISQGARVLDVGCGTGTSLFPAASKAGAHGYAIGVDI